MNIIVILVITGVFSYFVYNADYIPIDLWIYDKNFREIVLIFLITSIVTIFGIEYILTIQRDKEVIDNMRIIGMGYEIHVLYATLINFLIENELVELDEVGLIFHNYYETKRNQLSIDEAKRKFNEMTSEVIDYFEYHTPDNDSITNKNLSIDKAIELHKIYESQLESFEMKFLFAPKTNSKKLNRFSVIHELIKVNIHSLSRFIDDNDNLSKQIRVYLSTYRLLYAILEVIEYEKDVFFYSEKQYDEELTGKYSNKISQIKFD